MNVLVGVGVRVLVEVGVTCANGCLPTVGRVCQVELLVVALFPLPLPLPLPPPLPLPLPLLSLSLSLPLSLSLSLSSPSPSPSPSPSVFMTLLSYNGLPFVILANLLWLVGIGYYLYITFLGYSSQCLHTHTHNSDCGNLTVTSLLSCVYTHARTHTHTHAHTTRAYAHAHTSLQLSHFCETLSTYSTPSSQSPSWF